MRTVFFDVDTQLDFLYPAGALYVPRAERIIKSLAALTRYAAVNSIQIVSTADAHTEDDPEFKTWKPHCIAGTMGQQKTAVTLTNQPVVLHSTESAFDEIRPQLANAKQIIIEKQKLDVFSNPHLDSLIDIVKADRYVVYGVATELCVRCAALGLLKIGARVELVSDAIKSLKEAEEQDFINQFQTKGGRLTTLSAVTG